MRRRHVLRRSRLAQAALGATIIAVPTTATALAQAATTPSDSSSGGRLSTRVASRKIRFGREVVVTGAAPSSDAGQQLYLNYSPSRSGSWREIADGVVSGNGDFKLSARLRSSGELTVTEAPQHPVTAASFAPSAAGDAGAPAGSAEMHVTVAAGFQLKPHVLDELGNDTLRVKGQLLPGIAGRRVRLQALRDGSWQELAAGHTGTQGRFDLRFSASGGGHQRLRVLFSGDSLNGAATGAAGSVSVFVPSVASWYQDGGTTACGFHAYYGVANRTLPCGTKVVFDYHGKTVTAVVDDRGPYAPGRDWDLNQNTASALGFGGVDTVWSSQ